MSADNLVVLSGKVFNLETKKAGDKNLSEFSLGVYNWKKKGLDFHKVQLWGTQSDRIVDNKVQNKDEIRVQGELAVNEWEKDGKTNKSVFIRGTDFSYDTRQSKDRDGAEGTEVAAASDELPPF